MARPSVQDHAVARQEYALTRGIALDDEIPLARRDGSGIAAIDADAGLRELDREIGALVGRPFQAPAEFQSRDRLARCIARLDLKHGIAVGATLDVGVDLPFARGLVLCRRDLAIIGEARGIGAV